MNNQNIFTVCKYTQKEIFTTEFTQQPVEKLFASFLVHLIMNGPDRIEAAIKNSYTNDVAKKIFYTIGLLLKNYK